MSTSTIYHTIRTNLWRLIGKLAFNRITIVGEQPSATGPVLFVATHRNGALDAAPYVAAVPDAVPMVSAQLHRMPLGRLLFAGIAVARTKDRDCGIDADNMEAMQECLALLKHGGQVLIMPEGTSTLGQRHLPFHKSAARIVKAALEAGIRPVIVPLGVHYEDPTIWQSRVEVLVGEAINPQPNDNIRMLHSAITQGLEAVGANFDTIEAQRNAEALAYACTLGTSASYARSLKHFEQAMPEAISGVVQELHVITQKEQLCLHQGLPLVPIGPWPLYAAFWSVLIPVVLGFSVLNAPVLCAGLVASRKLPDDRNVIAFWRMVVALPTALVWAVVATVSAALVWGFSGVAGYWLFTVFGVLSWYRFRKLSVALCNALFHSRACPALLAAFGTLLELMSHDETV